LQKKILFFSGCEKKKEIPEIKNNIKREGKFGNLILTYFFSSSIRKLISFSSFSAFTKLFRGLGP